MSRETKSKACPHYDVIRYYAWANRIFRTHWLRRCFCRYKPNFSSDYDLNYLWRDFIRQADDPNDRS